MIDMNEKEQEGAGKIVVPTGVLLWFAIAVFNYGALFGNIYGELSQFHERSQIKCRGDMAVAMGIALGGPISLPVAIFGTGFMVYGFKWTC